MIFLQILKIIGIILLILLGILLLLVLLLLFYPVSYQIKGSYHKKLQIDGSFSWFFHLFSVKFIMEDQKQKLYLRILWFRKVFRDDFLKNEEIDIDNAMMSDSRVGKKESKHKNESKPYREEDFFDDDSEMMDSDITANLSKIETEETDTESEDEEKKKEIGTKKKSFDKSKNKKFSIISIIKEIWDKAKSFFKNLWQKICSICKTIEKFHDFLNDSNHLDAINVLKSELFHLLKILSPSRMKLESTFSTGTPDRTGQVLGILCLFPIAYQNRWKIYPDFESEEFYIEADFDVKGHVFFYQIIHIALKIVLNKNCRQLYNDIRK